jgi:hypothetical protein
MSYKVIVMPNPEDPTRVAVIYPTGELPIEELIRRHIDTTKPYQVMDATELPNQDGDYYEAWTMVSKNGISDQYSVELDMVRAREIHRNKLREVRKSTLEALDIQFMRAVERGDIAKQQEIAAKKQQLRDITTDPRIDIATSCEELRALTVETLT